MLDAGAKREFVQGNTKVARQPEKKAEAVKLCSLLFLNVDLTMRVVDTVAVI